MKKEAWSETRGSRPHSVWVGELEEKGGDVYLRFYRKGKRTLKKCDTGRVRDARGRLVKRLVEAARDEADAKAKELRTGIVARTPTGTLTIAEGVDLAFSKRGCFPLDPRTHAHTTISRRYADTLVRMLDEIAPGESARWEDITPGMIRSVYRTLEEQTRPVATGRPDQGANTAEKMLVCFFTIATWLAGEFPDQRFPRPMKGWRGEVKEFWSKMRRAKVGKHQPPHTPAEAAKILSAAPEKADPRLALALVLGPRLRGGQVANTMRSHCDLPAEGRWIVRVPFVSERKQAPTLYLNDRERAALSAAMGSGYLSECEREHQAGRLRDYALFPQGKLRAGKVVPERAGRPMSKGYIPKLLAKLERDAGVEHVCGRGWHGLRRMFADFDETGTDDERVKDALGGWTPGSDMRRSTYQEKQSEAVHEAAAAARQRMPSLPKEGES